MQNHGSGNISDDNLRSERKIFFQIEFFFANNSCQKFTMNECRLFDGGSLQSIHIAKVSVVVIDISPFQNFFDDL